MKHSKSGSSYTREKLMGDCSQTSCTCIFGIHMSTDICSDQDEREEANRAVSLELTPSLRECFQDLDEEMDPG